MTQIVSILQSLFGALFSTTEGSEGVVVQLFSWLTSADVAPYFLIGIAVSIVLLGIKVIRGVFWGL